jgi:hypothetical protein
LDTLAPDGVGGAPDAGALDGAGDALEFTGEVTNVVGDVGGAGPGEVAGASFEPAGTDESLEDEGLPDESASPMLLLAAEIVTLSTGSPPALQPTMNSAHTHVSSE